MGLSVVHGIVQSHHGEILVQSERGKGSVFQVYLPAIQSEHAAKEPLAVTPKGLESIMLVDDDEQVLKVLEKMLASLGYKVTALSNSLVALDTFIRQPESFDLGIFDLIMPNLTGLDLSKKIMAGHKPLPIIIMTGYGENIPQEKKIQHGIRQVIVKPVTLNELASTIRIALAKQIGG
jgi:CheY-like chemotaxis protein